MGRQTEPAKNLKQQSEAPGLLSKHNYGRLLTNAAYESLYHQSDCGMDRQQNDTTIWTWLFCSLVYIDALSAEPKPSRVERRYLVFSSAPEISCPALGRGL
jgi:hypothetical protein